MTTGNTSAVAGYSHEEKRKRKLRELMNEIILRFPTQTTDATFQDVNADQSYYIKSGQYTKSHMKYIPTHSRI